MPVKILVPTPMQRYTMNKDEIEVGGATVDHALQHLRTLEIVRKADALTCSGGPVSQHCAESDSPSSTCSGCGQPGTLWPPTVARIT